MKIIFLTFFIVINYIQAASLEEIKTALAKEFRNNFPKIIISQIDGNVNRKFSDEIGLNLLDF